MKIAWRRTVVVPASIALLGLLAGCGDSAEDPVGPPETRRFLFETRGVPDEAGRFVATTRKPDVVATLEAELKLPEDERVLHVHGPIARGDGGDNLSWSWHFVPDRWEMVEISVEVCDGMPKPVEEDVDHWVDTVGEFCPWGSYVQQEL